MSSRHALAQRRFALPDTPSRRLIGGFHPKALMAQFAASNATLSNWSLEFGAFLELGAWSLELAWTLVIGHWSFCCGSAAPGPFAVVIPDKSGQIRTKTTPRLPQC